MFSRTLPGFVTLSPCQHPGWQSLHLIDLKYHFSHLLKSLLVNGSWYGSIVPLMFSLSVPRGWVRCQVPGAASGSHPGSSAMSF